MSCRKLNYRFMSNIVAIICSCVGLSCALSVISEKKILKDGDIIFGGLFPMHEKGKDGKSCGHIKREKGIQRLEAMVYAIKRINSDPDLLPGIKVGYHVLDTCSFDTFALEQCMDFIKAQMNTVDQTDYQCDDGNPPNYVKIKPVTGVIGAAASTVSIMVANILRLFKARPLYQDYENIMQIMFSEDWQIPQISYASTSIDLSDKSRFEYFSRVVPPDTFQASAMVDIAHAFGWNYVSTLADDGNYGEKGVGVFGEMAKEHGICIAQSLTISRTATDEEFNAIAKELLSKNKARAVVMFVNEDNCRNLLAAFKRLNRGTEVTFLASDSWGAKIHPVFGQEIIAEGTVTLLPKRNVIQEFDDYFLKLTAIHAQRNPWFIEYWESIFNCTMRDDTRNNKTKCTGTEDIDTFNRNHYEQEGLVQFVIDSVYALAHAVHNLLEDVCPHSSSFKHCLHYNYLRGEDVLTYIRNVSFQGVGSDRVWFDKKGDGFGRYDIFQYQHISHHRYDYVKVGEWNSKLVIYPRSLKFRNDLREPLRSVCSEECPFNHMKNHSGEGDTCCWVCIRCKEQQILKDEHTCQDCPDGFKPNHNSTLCEPLPILHLSWQSLWVLLPVSVSSLGILACLLVLCVFIKYNQTPLILASGRELCYVLLCGIFVSYCTTFILLAKPNIILCAVKRFLLGISQCLIYAALLTRTNRIYRIFNRGITAMVKKTSYTSAKSQLFICLCIMSVQIVGGITWLLFEKPETIYIKQLNRFLVPTCKASQVAMLLSLVYNIALIVVCTVYGFKTRNIPQNFNEAKYIAFTMYSTCIVWLAFIPIYFGANHDFKIEITSLCMCISISATVSLVCLFGPKVYIVLLQPHKNVVQGIAATSAVQAAGGSFPKPYLPTNNQMAGSTTPTVTTYHSNNGHVTKVANVLQTTTVETMNDMFSDSLEEEDEDDFCDDSSFIPRPTEDKATSTSET